MNSEEELIFQKLSQFKQEIDTIHEDENYVSNKTFSKDSACWYLETWFNLSYCQTDHNYSCLHRDSVVLHITLDDLSVTMNELSEKIDTLYEKVYDLFEKIEAEDKEASLIWVDKKEISGTYLDVKIRVVFGIQPIASQWVPFGEDDDWYYGQDRGLCNPPPFLEDDAAELLTVEINSHRPTPPPPPTGYIYIYTIDPEEYELIGNEYSNPEDPAPCNYLDYLIFYSSEECNTIGDEEECLEDDEMNFYYLGEYNVIHSKMRVTFNKPDYWVNRFALIEDKADDDGTYSRIRHENYLKYGYRWLVPDHHFSTQIITSIEN